MFRRGVLLACLLGGIGQATEAGAWLRGEGDTFFSYGTNLRFPEGGAPNFSEVTLFYEYGLSPEVTLGFDANWVSDENAHVVAFMRRPLGGTEGSVRMSYTLGVGARLRPEGAEPLIRVGVSLGHGFESALGNAWASLDAMYEVEPRIGEDLLKLDATLGVTFESGVKGLVQYFWSREPGQPASLEFAPSVVFPLKDNMHLQVGLSASMGAQEAYSARASYWFEF